jgi:hypothetical protein
MVFCSTTAMATTTNLDELILYLEQAHGLSARTAERLVDEVLSYCSETVEEYVRRRHIELQSQEHKNEAIFAQISSELALRRFCAPPLSERQIRRLIYG